MKCFETLVKDHLSSFLPGTLNPLQFPCRPDRSTDDAITIALHTSLTHLDKRNEHVRILLIDYSYSCSLTTAFNSTVSYKLSTNLTALGLNSSLCNCVLDFLMCCPQVVKVDNTSFSTLFLKTGAAQGCVVSPLRYSLDTQDYVASHRSNSIIKFTNGTTVVTLINNNNETAYREKEDTDGVVPGKQPLPQENKGADPGLVAFYDKTAEATITTLESHDANPEAPNAP